MIDLMKTFDENNIERKAQDTRFSFFIYSLKNNSFDDIIQETIEINTNEIIKLKNLKINLTHDFNKIVEEIILLEKMKVLAEMKIVFAYKNFEINLKYFLINIFSDFNSELCYKKEYLKSFLKEKKIDYCKLSSYKEIDQLRRVNNAIKHAKIEQTKNINSIPELKNKNQIDYSDILTFYERVKKSQISFIIDLRGKILSNSNIKTSKILY